MDSPFWLTVCSSIGISGLVSTAISLAANWRAERQRWIRDQQFAEWRQLLDCLHAYVSAVRRRYEPPLENQYYPTLILEERRSQMRQIIDNRLFIKPALIRTTMQKDLKGLWAMEQERAAFDEEVKRLDLAISQEASKDLGI
jgi:hypothetical protein